MHEDQRATSTAWLRLPIALFLLLGLLVAACGETATPDADEAAGSEAGQDAEHTSNDTGQDAEEVSEEAAEEAADDGGDASTKVVTDYQGRDIEVPAEPTAVIGMDINYAADLVAVGITPIAGEDTIVGQFAGTEEFLPEGFDPASLPTFGTYWEPDVEVVLGLEPDLIIGPGSEWTEPFYDNFSQIAPTLFTVRGSNGDWQQRFRSTAEAVGRTDEADAVEADFQAFVDALPEGLGDTTVAFVRPSSDGGFLVDTLETSFPGSVARWVGIDLLQVDEVEPEEGTDFYELSGERLSVLEDADLLVVADFTVIGAEEDGLTQFSTNPLWQQLPAVQNGDVAQVPGLVYNGGNYFAAKALLAALAELLD